MSRYQVLALSPNMKITVVMKDPDGVHDSLAEVPEEEREKVLRWFKWSEYLTVEIDTVKNTCVVVREK